MYHFSLPDGNYKWPDNHCARNFSNIYTIEENEPEGWFFEIYDEIPVELYYSVKDFVFLSINSPLPRGSLSSYNLSLVENGAMHWTPSKQKLIVNLHPQQNIVVHHFFCIGCCTTVSGSQRFI